MAPLHGGGPAAGAASFLGVTDVADAMATTASALPINSTKRFMSSPTSSVWASFHPPGPPVSHHPSKSGGDRLDAFRKFAAGAVLTSHFAPSWN
jgi:hypothetical protein